MQKAKETGKLPNVSVSLTLPLFKLEFLKGREGISLEDYLKILNIFISMHKLQIKHLIIQDQIMCQWNIF